MYNVESFRKKYDLFLFLSIWWLTFKFTFKFPLQETYRNIENWPSFVVFKGSEKRFQII